MRCSPKSSELRAACALLLVAVACGGESASELAPRTGPPDVDPDATPVIVEFSADRSQINPREQVTLRWIVTDARAIEISDEDETVISSFNSEGTIAAGPLLRPTTFLLRAKNRDKTVTSEVFVDVLWQAPMINALSGRPIDVGLPARAALDWDVSNAETLIVKRDGQELHRERVDRTTGTFDVGLNRERHVFELIAENASGSVSREVEVFPQYLPAVSRLTISPRVWLGVPYSATISWRVEHATSVGLAWRMSDSDAYTDILGFPNATEGTIEVVITGPVEYSMSASSGASQFGRGENVFEADPEGEPNDLLHEVRTIRSGALGRISETYDIDSFAVSFGPQTNGLRITVLGENGEGCAFDNRLEISTRTESLAFFDGGGALAPSGGACAVAEVSRETLQEMLLIDFQIMARVMSENGETGRYALFTEEL